MSDPDNGICRWCKWWATSTKEFRHLQYGMERCVRHAPVAPPVHLSQFTDKWWPKTQYNDYCGDFERYVDSSGV